MAVRFPSGHFQCACAPLMYLPSPDIIGSLWKKVFFIITRKLAFKG